MSNTHNALIRTDATGMGQEVANNLGGGGGGGSDVSPEVEAILNVYGSKNLNSYPYYDTTKTENGISWTDNGDGTIFVGDASQAQTASSDTGFVCHRKGDANYFLPNATYILSGCLNLSGIDISLSWSDGTSTHVVQDIGTGAIVTIQGNAILNGITGSYCGVGMNIASGTVIPAGGITFKPMIRDARIKDSTYVPYAKTNLELTKTSATQEEMSNLVLTGTTNTSSATIAAGTCFVLNGDFVVAKTDIASGATFTLNTNYEKKSVGSILTELNSKTTLVQGTYNVDLTTLPCGTTGLATNANFLPSGIAWGVFIIIGGRHKNDSSYKAILLITNSTKLYYRLGTSGGTWTDWVQTGVV